MATGSDVRLLTLFRTQAGVVTRRQAQALGYTDRQISRRLASGQWIQMRRGVYRHALFDDTDEARVFALVLGGRGYVSHRHAASNYGLDPDLKRWPEVTLRRGTHNELPGVLVHETTQFRAQDITALNGLPISTVERTIMDVAAVERHVWKIMALIDSAREAALTDLTKLGDCLEHHARQGRDGTVRFRQALELIRPDERPAASPWSREVAAGVHATGLPYPHLEEEIRTSDGDVVAQVDLSFDSALLILLDGFNFHGKRRAQTNKDRLQRQRLRSMGFEVLEFTRDRWTENPGAVISEIFGAAMSARPRQVAGPSAT